MACEVGNAMNHVDIIGVESLNSLRVLDTLEFFVDGLIELRIYSDFVLNK